VSSSLVASPVAVRPARFRLDSGLTILFQEHRAADVAAVQLWVRVGASHEGDAESGLSHFIEHLLFKGTPSRGPGVIDRTVTGLGGEMNAATSQDFTYFHIVLPARHAATAVDILADAARRAVFDPDELERERLVVLEEIRRSRDSPSGELWRILSRAHFDGHPYGRDVLGTPESIGGAPRERIVDYHRRWYVPNNTTLVVVGNVDRDATLAEVTAAFAGWRPEALPTTAAPRGPDCDTARRVAEVRRLQQAYLGVAWCGPTVPDPDVYAVDVLASVLGRGRASRLNQALKERRGLVSTIAAGFHAQRRAGTIAVTARASGGREREIETALLAEIEALRSAPVNERELDRALTAVEADRAFGHETAEGVAYAGGLAETVWTLEFELGYLDEIRKVTPERVRASAQRYLAPDRFTMAVLTPAASPS
jgi:zinc protease